MRLEPGTEAPGFDTEALSGDRIRLEDLQGSKVWICFYRYFGCPLCFEHLFEVTSRQEQLEQRNLRILAVFESPRLKMGRLQGRVFPKFPLIGDPGEELFKEYGVERNLMGVVQPAVAVSLVRSFLKGFRQGKVGGNLDRIPAHFLISEDGTIHASYYGKHIADHIPWETVQGFLDVPPVPVKKKKGAKAPVPHADGSPEPL